MDAELDEENDVRPLPAACFIYGKNDMTETRGARATEAFFGRRQGKPVRERQAAPHGHRLPHL